MPEQEENQELKYELQKLEQQQGVPTYEAEEGESTKKIQEKLQRPDIQKGEKLQSFADDVSPGDMDFVFDLDDDDLVPNLLEPDEEKGEERITFTDDIPFKSKNKN